MATGPSGSTSKKSDPLQPNTLVVVQAFGPYTDMVRMNLPSWNQHGLPVVITSLGDSPVQVEGIGCYTHGRNGYVGPVSLDRWRILLRWLLEQPFEFFMMHESDSICLSPSIPRYCYENPDVLWSNEMPENGTPPTQQFYCVAPWFMSRRTITRLLETSARSPDRPPYHGDRWVGQMAEVGGIPHSPFSPGLGCGTLREGTAELAQVCAAVRSGVVMIHGVKTPGARRAILSNYRR